MKLGTDMTSRQENQNKQFKVKVNNYIYGNILRMYSHNIINDIKLDSKHHEIIFKYDPLMVTYLNKFRHMKYDEV